MNEDKVKQIFQDLFDENYRKGVPMIPPHRHTGVDNLQISYNDLTNKPAASGGTPGGSNLQVQFNDSGAFGGDAGLLYDKSISTLETNNLTPVQPLVAQTTLTVSGNAFGAYVADIALNTTSTASSYFKPIGGTYRGSGKISIATGTTSHNYWYSGDIAIATGSSSHAYANTGQITIATGDLSAGGNVGNISIKPGDASNASATSGNLYIEAGRKNSSNGNGGNVYIRGGQTVLSGNGYGGQVWLIGGERLNSNGSGNTTGGDVYIRGGYGRNVGHGGNVHVIAGRALTSGHTNGNIYMKLSDGTAGVTAGNLYIYAAASNSGNGGGAGIISISNAQTVPVSSPSGGGILYVDAGALKYIGSSGTVTPIAPA